MDIWIQNPSQNKSGKFTSQTDPTYVDISQDNKNEVQ